MPVSSFPTRQWLASLFALLWCVVGVACFQLPSQFIAGSTAKHAPSSILWMGLYDTPLPPRPPPREEDSGSTSKDTEQHDEEEVLAELPVTQHLFDMQDNGKESQNLLPPLGRRLDMGIGCYFEITDRKVINLAEQASCNPIDAAWALEACKGDTTEAWTCISVAKRMALESIEVELRKTGDMEADDKENNDELFLEKIKDQTAASNKNNNDRNSSGGGLNLNDVKADLYDMLREEEWEEMAEKRVEERAYQKRMDAFKLSEKDAQWLPTQNPRPIDDEPWFTG